MGVLTPHPTKGHEKYDSIVQFINQIIKKM